ncbi:MAG: tRNA (adenosine(37)-N6)-threonylcarbamoyltransferase complex dimerization subunit type 1 TsaB [Bradymonadia bacterium]
MKLLCIDTSSNTESIALTSDQDTVASTSAYRKKGHSSDLLKDIQEVMNSVNWTWDDLDGFGIGLGPGGFTSLRIGLATAKTLAHSLRKPLFGVSTLNIVNAAFSEPHCIPLIDAKRNEVYVDIPSLGLKCLPPSMLPEHFSREAPHFFCGDGAIRYADELISAFPHARINQDLDTNVPDARYIARLINPSQPDAIATLQPFYVRPSDAELTYPDGFPDAVVQFKL